MSETAQNTTEAAPPDQGPANRRSTLTERERARLYHIHGDLQSAADIYAGILRQDPGDAEALLNLSELYHQAGELELANGLRDTLLAVEHADPLIDFLLARHIALDGKPGKARPAAERAVRKEPGNPLYHYFYGLVLGEMGLLYDSHRELKEAVRLEPDNIDFLKALGAQCVTEYLYAATGVAAMERALQIKPDDPQFLANLVQLYYRNLRYRDAADCVKRLEGLGTVNVAQQLIRLSSLRALGDNDEAEAVAGSLLSLVDRLIAMQTDDDPRKANMHRAFKARVQMLIDRKDDAENTLHDMRTGWSPADYDFSRGAYLPNFTGRIERLRKIVGGRDIAILAHGPSLSGFEERLQAFAPFDLCYFGLNRFQLTEQHLLSKIGREADVIAVTPPHMMNDIIPAVSEFLARPKDNLLVTTFGTLGVLKPPLPTREELEKAYDEKLLYYESSSQAPPSPVEPFDFTPCNTLLVLMCVAALALPRRIFIFGADGGVAGPDRTKTHFKKDTDAFVFHLPDKFDDAYADAIHADTQEFNEVWEVNLAAICALYDLPKPEIYNVNPDSQTAIEPKISYERCLELLNSGT